MASALDAGRSASLLVADGGGPAGLSDFLGAAPAPDGTEGATATVTAMTYNTRRLRVSTPRPALLFVRDAFSPYWTAAVNGQPASIGRAFHNFKAVLVPSGESEVLFVFSPRGVALSLLAAYLALLGSAGVVVKGAWGAGRDATS
jgi:hypothetical protein